MMTHKKSCGIENRSTFFTMNEYLISDFNDILNRLNEDDR